MWMTPLSDNPERDDIIRRFTDELLKPLGDGQRKRAAGTKPPWYVDPSHEAAVYSHLSKWKKGELKDPDSGAHPLVHAACRMLMIACVETGNVPEAAYAKWSPAARAWLEGVKRFEDH